MATLNNAPVISADVNFGPRIWTAKVCLVADTSLAAGTPVTLDLEGYPLTGYILRGGVHLGIGEYIISGGGGGWRLRIASPELRAGQSFVRLYTALQQIRDAQTAAAKASGAYRAETLIITEPDRILARAWVARAGTGAESLDSLGLTWRVLADGTTRIGPNTGGTVDATKYAVEEYDPAHRYAVLGPRETADVKAIVDAIGGTLTGDPIVTPLTYTNIKIMLAGEKLRVEVEA